MSVSAVTYHGGRTFPVHFDDCFGSSSPYIFFYSYLFRGYEAAVLTYLELSLSWEAANCATIQEIPSNFKEPEGSSSCSQEPSAGPYPEAVRSSPYHPILSL
jgi:hypothetical protein